MPLKAFDIKPIKKKQEIENIATVKQEKPPVDAIKSPSRTYYSVFLILFSLAIVALVVFTVNKNSQTSADIVGQTHVGEAERIEKTDALTVELVNAGVSKEKINQIKNVLVKYSIVEKTIQNSPQTVIYYQKGFLKQAQDLKSLINSPSAELIENDNLTVNISIVLGEK